MFCSHVGSTAEVHNDMTLKGRLTTFESCIAKIPIKKNTGNSVITDKNAT